jgi:hypothetical protein
MPLLLLLLPLLAMGGVRSAARISASMSSKSLSAYTAAASPSRRLPFLLFFGIPERKAW